MKVFGAVGGWAQTTELWVVREPSVPSWGGGDGWAVAAGLCLLSSPPANTSEESQCVRPALPVVCPEMCLRCRILTTQEAGSCQPLCLEDEGASPRAPPGGPGQAVMGCWPHALCRPNQDSSHVVPKAAGS